MTRILAAIVAVDLITVGVLTPASPDGLASSRAADCAAVAVCVYQDWSYRGAYEFVYTPPAGTCVNLARLGNRVTSFQNHSGRTVRLHDGRNCGGDWLSRTNGTFDGNLAINVPWMNDDIESVRFL